MSRRSQCCRSGRTVNEICHYTIEWIKSCIKARSLWSRARGTCGRSPASVGASVCGLRPLSVPVWTVWGCLGAFVGGLRKRSGLSVGGLGWLLALLWALLGGSWGSFGWSWAVLWPLDGGQDGPRAATRGPTATQSVPRAVQDSQERPKSGQGGILVGPWGVLGASWGVLGLLIGPSWAVLGALEPHFSSTRARRRENGQSGEESCRKVAQTRGAERSWDPGGPPCPLRPPSAPTDLFYRWMSAPGGSLYKWFWRSWMWFWCSWVLIRSL